jgi:hypothetical protein
MSGSDRLGVRGSGHVRDDTGAMFGIGPAHLPHIRMAAVATGVVFLTEACDRNQAGVSRSNFHSEPQFGPSKRVNKSLFVP